MTQLRTLGLLIVAVFVVGPLFFADSYRTAAQDKKLKITIQAQAMGTSTQLGQTFNITAIVNEYLHLRIKRYCSTRFRPKVMKVW